MSAVLKKPPKPKVCKAPSCRASFVPVRMGQKTCPNAKCALEHIRAEKQRERTREKRAGLRKLRTRRDWLKLCQIAFNAMIRIRDEFEPCISCGRSTGAKRNAGHYLSVGSHPELRFHEDNCHSQCEHCNSWKSGNAVAYRIRLIEKIGVERVEWLEGPHEPAKWTIEELEAMTKEFRARKKQLERTRPGAYRRVSAGAFA